MGEDIRRTDLPDAVRCPACGQPTVSVVHDDDGHWQLFCRNCQATLTLTVLLSATPLSPPSAPPLPQQPDPRSSRE